MEISLEQYNKMAERLTELEYLLAERQWIPVSEMLPEDDYAVLVYEANHNNNFLAIYEDGRWKSFDPTYKATYFDETIYWHIIAWMPLPEPYKEVE